MKSLKQEQKTTIFTEGMEIKSKAEAKRVAKETEEKLVNEVNSFVDGLVEKYGKFLENDTYLQFGYFKLVKKDNEISVKFKR
ncbi:TPA: hypothetical protein LA460_000249 [Clostridium botulinum]|nr:hypothetical protein [Clostridium botulinum]HBJ1652853.1 hypothetical protein [Clostridium botulinum]